MSLEVMLKSDLPLRRVAPAAGDPVDMAAYLLLPSLEELLARPGFGLRDPIFLPGCRRPLDGWGIFGPIGARGITLH